MANGVKCIKGAACPYMHEDQLLRGPRPASGHTERRRYWLGKTHDPTDIRLWILRKTLQNNNYELSLCAAGADFLFTRGFPAPEQLAQTRPGAFILHFPAFYALTRKDTLCHNLRKHHRPVVAPSPSHGFVPLSYCLPGDADALKTAATSAASDRLFILKPVNRGDGKGISVLPAQTLVRTLEDAVEAVGLSRRGCVVSEYVDNPLLING